ncbi:MAG TPA: chromate transporter, partial [Ruminococcaceae bacterium]|nr:chromate transporter [Oscillospiraceae bacterium]
QLADMVAISESTPGPIGVNMATYVGFTTGGVLGSVIATIGLITPSIIIILIIASFLKAFRDNKYVKGAFYGLRPASTGLITAAGFSVVMISLVQLDLFRATGSVWDLLKWKGLLLAVAIFALTRVFKKLHPAVFIGASAVVGILFGFAGA